VDFGQEPVAALEVKLFLEPIAESVELSRLKMP
jgi:hypothetical protein